MEGREGNHCLPVEEEDRPVEPRGEVRTELLERWWGELQVLRREAGRDAEELLALPPDERRRNLFKAHHRFRSPYLAEALLAECRRQLQVEKDPWAAHELAQLAGDVALRSKTWAASPDIVRELAVRATAQKANALRLLGDLAAAERLLTRALESLRELPEPLARAEVFVCAALLRHDQGQRDRALRLLGWAAGTYRRAGEIDLAEQTQALRRKVLRDIPESGSPPAAAGAGAGADSAAAPADGARRRPRPWPARVIRS